MGCSPGVCGWTDLVTSFANPDLLWGLLVAPIGALWLVWRARQDRCLRDRFGTAAGWRRIASLTPGSYRGIASWCVLAAFACAAVALARPQGEPIEMREDAVGLNVLCVLDVSASMRATDLAPDRMMAAKTALRSFVEQLQGERAGLLLFAGTTAVQCPLTDDYATFLYLLERVEAGAVSPDGTAIGDAIRDCLRRAAKQPSGSTVVVLATDGENTKGEDPNAAAAAAEIAHVPIYTIGIGTPGGAKIPVGHDFLGRPIFLQYQGQDVVTKLDTGLLENIAHRTGARSYRARSSAELADAYSDIRKRTRVLLPGRRHVQYDELYGGWVAAAIGLLLLETILLLLGRRAAWRGVKQTVILSPVSRPALVIVLFVLAPWLTGFRSDLGVLSIWPFSSWKTQTNRAAELINEKHPDQAEDMAGDAHHAKPGALEPVYNLGVARYRQKKYDAAADSFRKSVTAAPTSEAPLYNLGNALLLQGKLRDAADAYRKAAQLNPADEDVQKNLAVVQRLLATPTPPVSSKSRDRKQSPGRPSQTGNGSENGGANQSKSGSGNSSAPLPERTGSQAQGNSSENEPVPTPTMDIGLSRADVDELLRRNRESERQFQGRFTPRARDQNRERTAPQVPRSLFELSPEEFFNLSPEQLHDMMRRQMGMPPNAPRSQRSPTGVESKDW